MLLNLPKLPTVCAFLMLSIVLLLACGGGEGEGDPATERPTTVPPTERAMAEPATQEPGETPARRW